MQTNPCVMVITGSHMRITAQDFACHLNALDI